MLFALLRDACFLRFLRLLLPLVRNIEFKAFFLQSILLQQEPVVMEPYQRRPEPFTIITESFLNLDNLQSVVAPPVDFFPPAATYSIKLEHDQQSEQSFQCYVPINPADPAASSQQTYEVVDASTLKPRFQNLLSALIEKPVQKKYSKATNIPKFILKVFNNNLPSDMDEKHSKRVHEVLTGLPKGKTRFDLLKLFGRDASRQIDRQNRLNRRILKRVLDRNYDNILRNNHIYNKRMYLLFCKKVSLRLSEPAVMDRLEV